jgi:hypothetical protein
MLTMGYNPGSPPGFMWSFEPLKGVTGLQPGVKHTDPALRGSTPGKQIKSCFLNPCKGSQELR